MNKYFCTEIENIKKYFSLFPSNHFSNHTHTLTYVIRLCIKIICLLQNRTQFCEKFIVPRTTAAGKYISLYRKIRDGGYYIHPTTTNTASIGVVTRATSTTPASSSSSLAFSKQETTENV